MADENRDSLNDAPDGNAVPEARVKRVTAAVSAGLLLISLLLPWWLTAYPLRNLVGELPGWRLALIGIGVDEAAPLTGFSLVGNVLFGLAPTLPLLVLIALLIVRALKPRAVHGSLIALWALFELLALGWLVMLGWAKINATLGAYPVMFGALVATIVSLFVAIAFWNWWRRGEKQLVPQRGRIQLGRLRAGPEPERVKPSEISRDLFPDE